jgi:hypothetical protein
MSETEQPQDGQAGAASLTLRLGARVSCGGVDAGDVADLAIDGGRRRLTHLVVALRGSPLDARLVPIERVVAAGLGPGVVPLAMTADELRSLSEVRELSTSPLPAVAPTEAGSGRVGIEDVIVFPSIGYGMWEAAPYDDVLLIEYDRIPADDIELRRQSEVVTADDHRVGALDGLTVRQDGEVVALRLERGHLWGRRRVSIPVESVAAFETDRVALRLTRAELPSFESPVD